MKILTRTFLASLIIIKIILGSIFIYQVELDPLCLERDAIASKPPKDSEGIAKAARQLSAITLAQASQAGPSGEAGGEEKNIAGEEKIDLNFLLKKEVEINIKEEELKKKRTKLMAIQEEINNKIAILTQLRNDIRAQMAKKKAIKEQNFRQLIKAYSSMKPQKAASLIEKLDLKFSIELLSKMKANMIGPILSFIDIEKAAKITEGIAKRD